VVRRQSGRTVAQANQDQAHGQAGKPRPDPDPLQRAKSTPLTGSDEVYPNGAEQDE